MSDRRTKNVLQVIRSVNTPVSDRSRLTLQSVCGADGRRYLRAVWEYRGEDGNWHGKPTPPEFVPTAWADVFAKAAASGMLSSEDYKNLLVRLTRGLDSGRNPTPKAFVRFTGRLRLSFPEELLASTSVDEVLIYEALSGPARDVTVTQSHKSGQDYRLVYQVVEDIHYVEAISRLPRDLRKRAGRQTLEEVVSAAPREAFEAMFGSACLPEAGFRDPEQFTAEYHLSVL